MESCCQCRKRGEETATTDLLKSINRLVSMKSRYGPYERVDLGGKNLGGKNVGASMTVRRGSCGKSPSSFCNINIYINSNVQGVNNSLLLGSEVKMGDPGVWLSLSDVEMGKGSREMNKKRDSGLGLLGVFLVVVVAAVCLLWSFWCSSFRSLGLYDIEQPLKPV